MRRTLLSCTSLARHRMIALATVLSTLPKAAIAAELTVAQTISALFDLNHQEFAALTTAVSLLGFTVVAAILLMRTRVRASRTELSLRSDIADLQVQADRLRALLFAEPQILIAWAAGDNRPQISGDTSLLISQDAMSNSPQRILAFGTWLPPEPALQMDHAVRRLREAGQVFLLKFVYLERPRHRSDGPRHRRTSHCADLRTRWTAPGARRIQLRYRSLARRDRAAA